jgi:hypothetical protein
MDQKDNDVLEPLSWKQAEQAHLGCTIQAFVPCNDPLEVHNTFYGYLIKLFPLDIENETQAEIWNACEEAGFSAVLIDTLQRTQAMGYRYLSLDCDAEWLPDFMKGTWND